MLTLALDCSTARGSVALAVLQGDDHFRIVREASFTAGRGHGGELFTALEHALAQVQESGDRLGQIVVGLGPGSYSGVRQTIAAATGLSVATGAALHGVPSPVALETDALAFHALGDARRGAFYYTAVENGQPLAPGPVLLPDRAALDAQIARNPVWPILAVEAAADLLPPGARAALPVASRLLTSPRGGWIAPPLEPIYLRPVAFTLPKART